MGRAGVLHLARLLRRRSPCSCCHQILCQVFSLFHCPPVRFPPLARHWMAVPESPGCAFKWLRQHRRGVCTPPAAFSPRFVGLTLKWRVTAEQHSYKGCCGGAMAAVSPASMLFGGGSLCRSVAVFLAGGLLRVSPVIFHAPWLPHLIKCWVVRP